MAAESAPSCRQPGIAWLPLGIGLGLLVAMTLVPAVAVARNGQVDHVAALLICWAMSAGFVRGVGYVPEHPIPRWLLSRTASLGAFALAALRVAGSGSLALLPGLI